jgi:hypothetical protein
MSRFFILFLMSLPFRSVAQPKLVSGKYRELNIAFDAGSKTVTGYYESYSGYDEQSKQPMFSCAFYIEGKVMGNEAKVKTYYPADSSDDVIFGDLKILHPNELTIHLPDDHGGCWNVEHFKDAPNYFRLDTVKNWMQIRYAVGGKVYFHATPSDTTKLKAFILKGDIVYVDSLQCDWAHCSYIGRKTTKAWVKVGELNGLD